MTYRLQGVFTAIADPHRRQMLDYLAASDLTAGELAEKFPISRPAVVNHLKILEANNLVVVIKNGRHRVHRLNPEPLMTIRDWISKYDRFWTERLEAFKALVEDMPERPEE
jgi:DNA-binding transcriptional ArsR family regulator